MSKNRLGIGVESFNKSIKKEKTNEDITSKDTSKTEEKQDKKKNKIIFTLNDIELDFLNMASEFGFTRSALLHNALNYFIKEDPFNLKKGQYRWER